MTDYQDTARELLVDADVDLDAREPLLTAFGILHQAPDPEGDRFDPSGLVRAVRWLVRLGGADAVRVLRSYTAVAESPAGRASRLQPAPEKVLLVARLLFFPRGRGHAPPPMLLGKPDVEGIDDSPLLVEQGVPFLPVGGYHVGGVRPTVQRDLDWYEQHAKLPAAALEPQTSPVTAAEALVGSPRWERIPTEQRHYARSLVYRQALRAILDTGLVTAAALETIATATAEELERRWNDLVSPSLRRLAWDDARMAFAKTS
jgi:hypothetical protein